MISHAREQTVAGFTSRSTGFNHTVNLCGICGGQKATGQLFLGAFMFFQPIIIPPMLHINLLLGVSIMGPFEAAIPRDLVFPHFYY
jgi:hypothetical protein